MVKQITRGKDIARNTYWSAVGMTAATMLAVQPVFADTIWDRFSTILKDVYGQVVAISTIVAVTVAAIALLIRMISRNQRAVEEATSWLKRIVVMLDFPSFVIFLETISCVSLGICISSRSVFIFSLEVNTPSI